MFIAAVQNRVIDFSAVKIDVTDIYIFAGIILAAICAIWGIRKMVALGYLSSVPGHWQKRYEREQDLADYREFRDEGGFESGTHLGSFGGRSWYLGNDVNAPLSDEESYEEWAANYEPSSHVDVEDYWDDGEFESAYIGSVGDKSWYYDQDGEVFSTTNGIPDEPPYGWYDENDVLHIYEGHEDEYNEWLERIKNDVEEEDLGSSKIYGLWDDDEEYKQDLSDSTDKYIH